MTEYWKSYAKKFCEICKCWYADNKISIERHEMGDRHKAMVQQRLREGAKKAKDKEVADHDLRVTILAMEQSARASMGIEDGKRRREVPTATVEPKMVELQSSGRTAELLDPIKEELREQKRKLKELKKKSKQSQLWIDDEVKKEEGEDGDGTKEIEWVHAETPGGVRYYWHIFNGETRWDQPAHFYTPEEYAERYAEIAAKNHLITATSSAQQTSSSFIAAVPSQSNFRMMFSPHIAPQMPIPKEIKQPEFDDAKQRPNKREFNDDEKKVELSREERRKIKRERRAMAEAKANQMPDGLVEIKREEEPTPIAIINNEPTIEMDEKSHPLGPWIPVKKEEAPPPKLTELEKCTQQKGIKKQKRYDDLPEQEYGPGTSVLANAPAELLEIAEMDPEELAFKNKEAPAIELSGKKKSSKIIGFRKPPGVASKSLRTRPSTQN